MPARMKAEHLGPGPPLQVAQPISRLDPVDTTAHTTALVFRTLACSLRVRIVAYLHQRGLVSRAQLTSALSQTWGAMEHHLTAPVRTGS